MTRLRTLGEEAFGATAVWSKFDNFHMNCHPCFAACSVIYTSPRRRREISNWTFDVTSNPASAIVRRVYW